MRELHSAKLMYVKAGLLLAAGILSAAAIVMQQPTIKTLALLAVCVWAFCRAYYFAFYVMQRYVEPGYRFSGLMAFARYVIRRSRNTQGAEPKLNQGG